MTWEQLAGLFAFAAISSWTPGPNNTILMASGINHGFRKTLPMIMAVTTGFPLMIIALGLGLGQIVLRIPMFLDILHWAGAAYLLYLAFKIATSKPSDKSDAKATAPFTFIQGVLFQWINPKGWMMALTALSTYTIPSNYWAGVALVTGAFAITGCGSSPSWTLFGASLRNLMNDPRWFRIVNVTLAATLVASLVPMLRH